MPRPPPPTSALPEETGFDTTLQGPSTTSPFMPMGKMMMAGPQTAPHLHPVMKGAWDEGIDSGSSGSSECLSSAAAHYHSVAIQTSPSMLEPTTPSQTDRPSICTAPAGMQWQQAAEQTESSWQQYSGQASLMEEATSLNDLFAFGQQTQPSRAPAVTAPALVSPMYYDDMGQYGLVNDMSPMITLPVLAQCLVTMPLISAQRNGFLVNHPVVTVGNPPLPATNPAMTGVAQPQPAARNARRAPTVKITKPPAAERATATATAAQGKMDAEESSSCSSDEESDDGEEGDGKRKRRRRRRRRHRGRGRRGRGKTKKAAAAAEAAALAAQAAGLAEGEGEGEGVAEHGAVGVGIGIGAQPDTDHEGMPAMCSSEDEASLALPTEVVTADSCN